MNYSKSSIIPGGIRQLIDSVSLMPVLGPMIRHRFFKFATVGFSGTIINLVALYINQVVLLRDIQPAELRLKLSLGGAIFLATVNNYLWNRLWTWSDRKSKNVHGFFVQMGQYFLACGLAIGLQYIFTILLAGITHYLIANIIAIVLAAVFVYIINDIWTFAVKRSD